MFHPGLVSVLFKYLPTQWSLNVKKDWILSYFEYLKCQKWSHSLSSPKQLNLMSIFSVGQTNLASECKFTVCVLTTDKKAYTEKQDMGTTLYTCYLCWARVIYLFINFNFIICSNTMSQLMSYVGIAWSRHFCMHVYTNQHCPNCVLSPCRGRFLVVVQHWARHGLYTSRLCLTHRELIPASVKIHQIFHISHKPMQTY